MYNGKIFAGIYWTGYWLIFNIRREIQKRRDVKKNYELAISNFSRDLARLETGPVPEHSGTSRNAGSGDSQSGR